MPIDQILYKELVVSSGFASTPVSWRRAMLLIDQGRVRLAPLVTRTVQIEDWQEAFSTAQVGEGIKTVVLPR